MATTLTEMKAKAVNKTQGDVKTEELVDTLAKTLFEMLALRNAIH